MEPDRACRPDFSRRPAERRCLLALASSGAWISAALLCERAAGIECNSLAEPAGADQSARLFTMIDEVLAGTGLDRLDAIAFDAGPGAFTGLRIACSVAQGLAFVRELPVVEVGSLEAAAWRSLRQGGRPAVALVANDARMGEIYGALCLVHPPDDARRGPQLETLVGPMLCAAGSPPSAMSRAVVLALRPELAEIDWLAAGDAWGGVGLGEGWHAMLSVADATGAAPGDAQAVAEIAHGLWLAGNTVCAEAAAPRYVRDKVALDLEEQRRWRARRASGQ